MRPRLEGRGEQVPSWSVSRKSRKLQCGHGSKAVENRRRKDALRGQGFGLKAATGRRPWQRAEPSHAVNRFKGLQCGHGSKAVANREHGRLSAGGRGASMRPRLEGRGEQAAKRIGASAWYASMRPRLEG